MKYKKQNNPITLLKEQMLSASTLAFVHRTPQTQIVYYLGLTVPTFHSASNSVILSLAAYITWKFPYLSHPELPDFAIVEHCHSEVFPSAELSYHPLHEAWADCLCQCVVREMAIREGNTLYLLVPVEEWYLKELEGLGLEKKVFGAETKIGAIFNHPEIQHKQKKIILMNFATSQLRENKLLPKINLPSLLMGSMYNNEKWSYYLTLKGEVPTLEALLSADTIILPGSSNSVLDFIAPVQELVSLLREAYVGNPGLKVLSICYGHQLVARMYGAEIVRKERYEGHQEVVFEEGLVKKYGFLDKIAQSKKNNFTMPEHHEDYVETVPQGFDLVATSKSCLVQAMVKQDGRILSLQFHPEYLSQYTLAFTARAKAVKEHYHLSFALGVEASKLEEHHFSCNLVRECIKDFLDSDGTANVKQFPVQ